VDKCEEESTLLDKTPKRVSHSQEKLSSQISQRNFHSFKSVKYGYDGVLDSYVACPILVPFQVSEVEK